MRNLSRKNLNGRIVKIIYDATGIKKAYHRKLFCYDMLFLMDFLLLLYCRSRTFFTGRDSIDYQQQDKQACYAA